MATPGLTLSEQDREQIAQLAALGYSRRQIARALGLSKRTVDKYVKTAAVDVNDRPRDARPHHQR